LHTNYFIYSLVSIHSLLYIFYYLCFFCVLFSTVNLLIIFLKFIFNLASRPVVTHGDLQYIEIMSSPVDNSACEKYCPPMNVHLPLSINSMKSGDSTVNLYRPLLDPLIIEDQKLRQHSELQQCIQPLQTIQPLQSIRPLQIIQPHQSIQPLQSIRPLQIIQPHQSIQPIQSIRPNICLEILQPQQQRKTKNTSLYKTRQCKSFSRNGSCRYNKNCQFAHGVDDVVFSNRFKNYKTRPCNNYSSAGVCYFGQECSFLHIGDSTTHPFDFISDFLVMPRPLRRLDVFNKIFIQS
jgi:hypothetical protein